MELGDPIQRPKLQVLVLHPAKGCILVGRDAAVSVAVHGLKGLLSLLERPPHDAQLALELRLGQHAIPVQVHRSKLEPVHAVRRRRHRQSTTFGGRASPQLHASLQPLLPIRRLRLDRVLDLKQLGSVELERVLGFLDLPAQRWNEV